jgi:hypothetical protein
MGSGAALLTEAGPETCVYAVPVFIAFPHPSVYFGGTLY